MLDEKYEDIRTRAYRRHLNFKKALRKKKITDSYYSWGTNDYSYYKHLNQYNKGKIHCSCPMCRSKTNNKHRKGSLVPNYNPTIKEIKINNSMDNQIQEFKDE